LAIQEVRICPVLQLFAARGRISVEGRVIVLRDQTALRRRADG
jgi:hypothetical protein